MSEINRSGKMSELGSVPSMRRRSGCTGDPPGALSERIWPFYLQQWRPWNDFKSGLGSCPHIHKNARL